MRWHAPYTLRNQLHDATKFIDNWLTAHFADPFQHVLNKAT
jgi:hypothetical protein